MAPPLVTVVLIAIVAAVAVVVVVVLLLVFRPWRFLPYFYPASRFYNINDCRSSDDIERPLISENADATSVQSCISGGLVAESSIEDVLNFSSPSRDRASTDNASYVPDFVVDVSYGTVEDLEIGQTLKRSAVPRLNQVVKHRRLSSKFIGDDGGHIDSSTKGSCLTLEVIAGLARGLNCSLMSTDSSMLPLITGRVSPCDLVLKDSEVSGKHAHVNWNSRNSTWELVDLGSLNGTSVNSVTISDHNSGSRHWSEPFELSNGDIITFGTSSKICVQIAEYSECRIPYGVGLASDAMTVYRGGRSLPMEDVSYCQWPLPRADQFGLFGIFDGHGGAEAAKTASRLLPENVVNVLSNPVIRERILSLDDSSDVLREAFSLTEAAMNHQYEGCTATVLLIWVQNKEFFAQCANVGDSTCFMNVSGKLYKMTEDHRITSPVERSRMEKAGKPLKDGETRLCGINIGRMLGDKFLKEQDSRFSSEPYISPIVCIPEACSAFSLLASDGLWDVMGTKKAAQLVLQMKQSRSNDDDGKYSAEAIANLVLGEAKALRTKDNTSIIFLDFNAMRIGSP